MSAPRWNPDGTPRTQDDTWEVGGFRVRAFAPTGPGGGRSVVTMYVGMAKVTGTIILNLSPAEARELASALTEAAAFLDTPAAEPKGGGQ